MLLYSVLHIFSVQLNLMDESKASKEETLAESKGDETTLIVQNARHTGETLVLHMHYQRNMKKGISRKGD